MELLRLGVGIGSRNEEGACQIEANEKPWTWVPTWGAADLFVPRTFKEGGRLGMIEERSE